MMRLALAVFLVAPLLSQAQNGAASFPGGGSVGPVGPAGPICGTTGQLIYNNAGVCAGGAGLVTSSGSNLSIGTNTAAPANGLLLNNVNLTGPSANVLHIGGVDAATATAQTLGVQGVVAGTSNVAGANFTIAGSQGTGTGAGGSLIFQTAPAGGSGTSQNALVTGATLDSTGKFSAKANYGFVGLNSGFTSPNSAAISVLLNSLAYYGFSTNGISLAAQNGVYLVDGVAGQLWVGLNALGSNGSIKTAGYFTDTNCSSSASPAVCAASAGGSVVVAAAATTVVVNTTAVTANSQIFVTYDSSLGTKLGVTCNTTEPALFGVTARTAATSFTITASAPITNPACFSYSILN